ncbi:hypothetical protein MKQ70_32455 [Chitinophaga sedimenti]|uniref:hypothetical protein n=1 Tax=Chitinophaga sedimenti TaxID=2033606 RepID=UPI0020054CC8|nr:hypothetical protein [Chitinophaga sedimenti]MCK7559429.1 hypothetical protein [Chitinophaga sedimenti]
MVKEYKAAFKRFSGSGLFSEDQLDYIASVHKNLIDGSLNNLDELLMVITAKSLRMNDAERISAIDRIYLDVEKKLHFLRTFNNQQSMVGLQRLGDKQDINNIKTLHGLK